MNDEDMRVTMIETRFIPDRGLLEAGRDYVVSRFLGVQLLSQQLAHESADTETDDDEGGE